MKSCFALRLRLTLGFLVVLCGVCILELLLCNPLLEVLPASVRPDAKDATRTTATMAARSDASRPNGRGA